MFNKNSTVCGILVAAGTGTVVFSVFAARMEGEQEIALPAGSRVKINLNKAADRVASAELNCPRVQSCPETR